MSMNNFTVERLDDIAIFNFDSPNKAINVLTTEAFNQLFELVKQIETDDKTKSVIIISNKKNNFIAGADIKEITSVNSAQEAELLVKGAHKIFNFIEKSKKKYIAAINGVCFGGGFELALACDFRIASADKKTLFSFPEVKLGILPAAGGTQRLPRLTKLSIALDMLLTGKKIHAKRAKSYGILDLLVNTGSELRQSAISFARTCQEPKVKRKPSIFGLIPLYIANQKMVKKTHGLYPAPKAIIDAVKTGIIHGFAKGATAEIEHFGRLVETSVCKNLVWLFFAQTARGKNPYKSSFKPKKLGILGSGLMGSGIAHVSIENNLNVLLSDNDEDALLKAKKNIYEKLQKEVKRGKISHLEQTRIFSDLVVTTDLKSFEQCDAIIEAVYEDLQVKQALITKLEPHLRSDCIFASNTSSLPIKDIAENSSMKDRILGMHYFSPVEKVPLLEIVKTKESSEISLATAFEIGKLQKRTMILVNDSPGFYTTRVIAALFDEASILLLEGHSPNEIDERLKNIGFPMGPVALMDDIGLDVGLHVSETLYHHFGSRLIAANLDLCRIMIEKKFNGRKVGKGFYEYNQHRKKINHDFLELLKPFKQNAKTTKDPIEDRMFLRMVNEATFCLFENIIHNSEDGDVGAVFGIGFPPHLGGPFRYIEAEGKDKIAKKLDRLYKTFGNRFKKSQFFG